jgi:hypothetical protein
MKRLKDGRVLVIAERLQSLCKHIYAVPVPNDCVTEEQVKEYVHTHDLTDIAECLGEPIDDVPEAFCYWPRCGFADEQELEQASVPDPDDPGDGWDDEDEEAAE